MRRSAVSPACSWEGAGDAIDPSPRRGGEARTVSRVQPGGGGAIGSIPFPALVDGPTDGELVVLLHGFPQTKAAWSSVASELAGAGYRAVAFDQRGYRPERDGQPPPSLELDALAEDVLAVVRALGRDRFHVVGHDWGGAVAWRLAADAPESLLTATIVATPHPRALVRSMVGAQAVRSLYVAAFQVPALPEMLLRAGDGALLRALLVRSGLDRQHAGDYTAAMLTGDVLHNALGWYRANGVGSLTSVGPSRVPTLYVWPSGDVALGRRAAERTAQHVDAPYRFVVLEGVPHWVPEGQPKELADFVVDHVRTGYAQRVG
jgi:pimeloyl-ACP methyl ester carboxylesterase